MHVLIDGDILLYKAGFSVELSRHYKVWWGKKGDHEHNPTQSSEPQSLLACRLKQEELYTKEGKISEVRLYVEAEPIENAIANIKAIIKRVIKDCQADSYNICLSGPSDKNYRYVTAVTKPYKGTRDSLEKPWYFNQLRDYLMKQQETVVSFNSEGDDLMGYLATSQPNTIIASIDKDMMMIPGINYNLNTKHLQKITDPGEIWLDITPSNTKVLRGYGFKWFCAQMLLGDTVDNIPGLKGYGPVKTLTTLDKCTTIRGQWAKVIRTYRKSKVVGRLEEIKALLWIQRNNTFGEVIKK